MAKVFTFAEVEKHNGSGDCWLILHGKVYDVSQYAEEHPGGDLVLFAATGKDATFEFEDRGHSDEARELLSQFEIGDIDVSSLPVIVTPEVPSQTSSFLRLLPFLLPLSILALALCLKFLSLPKLIIIEPNRV